MIPIAFVSARTGRNGAEALARRMVQVVRDEFGAVAAVKNVHIVPQLPKTRSGKILRNLLRKIVNSQSFEIPPTIEDTSVPAATATLVEAKSANGGQRQHHEGNSKALHELR